MLRQAWQQSRGSISLILVGVCTAGFLVTAMLGVTGICDRQEITSFLGLSYVGVFQQYWVHQLVTAPLMHANITHLLFNMLSLWMLGPGVEKVLGRRRYVLFSFFCAAASMAGWLLFNWGTGSIAVGYSGVIFGILVAQAVFFPDDIIALFAFFPLKMKYAVLLLGAVEFYLTVSPEDQGIAHAAHVFGAVAAFVYLGMVRWQDARAASRLAVRTPAPKIQRRPVADRAKVPFEL